MELTLDNNFEEITNNDLELIDGGSRYTAAGIMIVGGAVIAGVLAPLTCGGSLAAYAQGAWAGYTLMATGVWTSIWG